MSVSDSNMDWLNALTSEKNDVGEVFVNFHAFYFNDMS